MRFYNITFRQCVININRFICRKCNHQLHEKIQSLKLTFIVNPMRRHIDQKWQLEQTFFHQCCVLVRIFFSHRSAMNFSASVYYENMITIELTSVLKHKCQQIALASSAASVHIVASFWTFRENSCTKLKHRTFPKHQNRSQDVEICLALKTHIFHEKRCKRPKRPEFTRIVVQIGFEHRI